MEFRRRFFTRLIALQTTLDRQLEFSNHRRPHLGSRTAGRPPAELFWGVTGRPGRDWHLQLRCVHTLATLDTGIRPTTRYGSFSAARSPQFRRRTGQACSR